MKEKGVTKTALILLVLVCVFAIVACSDNVNTDGDVCKHIYTEKAEATYLKSAATCTEKAVYYKSCSLCGEKDTATFEYGEALGHAYGNGVSNGDGTHTRTCANDATHKIIENCSGGTATCTEQATCEICNASYGNLAHTLDDDGKCTICGQQIVGTEGVVYVSYDTYAVVTGYIGTESDVKIAAFYKDLPVICIGNLAFYGCTSSLTSVTIPDSVTSIGNLAFYGCTSLTSVTIPDGVTSINSGAFYNCTSLTSVNITDIAAWCNISFGDFSANPLFYAENLYLNNNLVTALTIPDSVTSIGNLAFSNCTALTSVTIGNNVKNIGYGAFSDCTSLTSVTIPDSITSIGNYAFCYCTSLTSVAIPGSVTSINSGAFSNCTSLTSVTIPDSVTSIGNIAFYGCTALKTVYYKGTAADWVKISIGNNNSYITNTKRYYYSESKPTGSGNYWHYVDGKPTVWPSDE